MSDYCLDDKGKNDCITFTICPMVPNYDLSLILKKKLPRDIKDITKPTDEEIKFIRDPYPPFFTISILIKEKEKCASIDYLKEDVKNLKESPHLNEREQKKLNKFNNYLKQKNINHKVLKNMAIIAGMFTRIVEFLTIKHHTEEIHWFPDRDAIMDISDGIILDLVNIQCQGTELIRGRKIPPKLRIGGEDKKNNVFRFDPLVRYPDIITGVVSSIDFDTYTAQEEKHVDLFVNAILGNPRIVIMEMSPNEFKTFPLHKRIKTKNIIRASEMKNV